MRLVPIIRCPGVNVQRHREQQSQKQQQFCDFVSDHAYPCVGAKAALNKQRMTFAEYPSLDKDFAAADLCHRLHEFATAHPDPGAMPASFVALFDDVITDEVSFEAALWKLFDLAPGIRIP